MHGKVVYLHVCNTFYYILGCSFYSLSFIHIILFIFLVNALIVALAIRNFLKCAGIGKLLFTVNIQKKLHSFLVFKFLSNFSLLICFFFVGVFFSFFIQCRDDGKFRTVS